MISTNASLQTRNLPAGFLLSESLINQNRTTLWSSSICNTCAARANSFCMVETGRWSCVICKQWNILENDKTREFSFANYEVSLRAEESRKIRKNPHCMLLLDENLSKAEFLSIRDAINETLHKMSDDSYFGLITFGSCVKIFELGSHHKLMSEIFNGKSSPSNEDIRELSKHENASSGSQSFKQ